MVGDDKERQGERWSDSVGRWGRGEVRQLRFDICGVVWDVKWG